MVANEEVICPKYVRNTELTDVMNCTKCHHII